MKIIILGGFLGSGKTTLLLQLAKHLAEHSSGDKKCGIAIIENEIGQVGIDDKLLKSHGYAVRDIFSGCVCCSLSGDLISGIREIEETLGPEWVIIEATGVAFPDIIAETLLSNLKIESRIITIVDVSRWKRIRIPMENLIKGQLRGANWILINKIDLVNEIELDEVIKEISVLNSNAKFFKVSGIKPVDVEILREIQNG